MEKKDNAYSFLVEEGYTLVEDIKIMVNKFPEVLSFLEARHIPVYGNVGVGLLFPHFYKGQEKHIPELLTFVKKLGGHVNGRHGIGIMKKQYLEFNDKKILENIKKRTDPRQKFNIGKVI